MMCLVTRVALKYKMNNNGYESHNKVTPPLTDTHNDIAGNAKEDRNLGNLVTVISRAVGIRHST